MIRRMRWRRLLALLLVVALFAASCGDSDEGTDETQSADTDDATDDGAKDDSDGDESNTDADSTDEAADDGAMTEAETIPVVRLAGGIDWGAPHPYGFNRGPGFIRSTLGFDSLIWKQQDGTIIPWLADSWTTSDDGLTWVYQLNPNARWHDGKDVTAADVVFTFGYQSENPPGFPLRAATEVAEIEATGDREVTFTLTAPYAAFETNLAAAMQIIPQHIWDGVDDPAGVPLDDAVIGSGPYMLDEYNPEDGSYLFVANDDFFLGAPVVKRLEFLPVDDAVLAVSQGVLDAGGPGVQGPTVEGVVEQFNVAPYGAITGPGEWTMALKFNMTKAPFDDPRFRQAVAYAIDRQDMVDRILLGNGQPGNVGWLSPANAWFNSDVTQYSQDAETANGLLDDLGLVDTDGDGTREMADGTPLSYELPFASFDSPRNAELIQIYLAEVGIDVTAASIDRGERDERASSGDFDMILVGYGGLGGDPDLLRTTLASKGPPRFNTPIGWDNQAFIDLANEQLRITDRDQRQAVIDEMQAIIADDVPSLPLYHPTRFWFYNSDVIDDWYYTVGGIASGVPVTIDKNFFVMGGAG